MYTKDILRIVQSIPSPKAEPFKMWLAQVGSERLEDTHRGGNVAMMPKSDLKKKRLNKL